MRLRTIVHAFATTAMISLLAVGGNASAQDECVAACGPLEDFTGPMSEYASATKAHFLTGLNGLVTMPADPVMNVVDPPKEYQDLPVSAFSSRFFGGIQGIVMMAYRGGMGVLDMILAPIPIVILSPEPRYQPIPGFEWDG